MTIAEKPPYKLVFGYKTVTGVPRCPCGDPGNYLSMSQSEVDPLNVKFQCWCGRTIVATMDDQAELDEFLAKNGVTVSSTPQTGGS